MKEVFLYACEICGNVVIEYGDCGNSHLYMCNSCNGGTFHNKILIMVKALDNDEEAHVFVVEEKDDNKKEE